jgi:hypothetical protein
MPGLDTWTVNSTAVNVPENEVIQSIALNLGAPGDRCDTDGVLWLEHPAVGGESPFLAITLNEEVQYFQQHSSTFASTELPWVYASGAMNVQQVKLVLRTQKAIPPAAKSSSDDDDDKKTAKKTAKAETESTESTTKPEPQKIEFFNEPFAAKDYQLELYFSLPVALQQNCHEFSVRVSGNPQSQTVKLGGQGKDIAQSLIFDRVRLDKELMIELESHQGTTVLSGLRLMQQ